MYLILVYDVGVERVAKVCKTLRRRLTWVQNSVFEGEVSEADFKKIQLDLFHKSNSCRSRIVADLEVL